MLTEFGTNDAATINRWGMLTLRESLKHTWFHKFLGMSDASIIKRIADLEKRSGDMVRFDILMQAISDGITGDNRLKNNEEELVYHQDTLKIDQLRNAHAFKKMTAQRTLHELRKDAQLNLSEWFTDKFDTFMFDAFCGNTSGGFTNTPELPDNEHYVTPENVNSTGVITTDEASLGTDNRLTLAEIDFCIELAKTLSPTIRPTKIDGEDYYVLVMHTNSIADLRHDITNSSYTSWDTIQGLANERGKENPIFSGALGIYNKTILYDSTRIYSPTTNIRRHVFLGAGAATFGIGNAYNKLEQKRVGKDNLMSWYEDVDDFGNENGVGAGCIFGIKANRFNNKDFAKIVLPTYAAPHQ